MSNLLARRPTYYKHFAYHEFHIVAFVRESPLLSIERRIWMIPALVEEAIIREAEWV
jgi:hypothetical protein